MIGLVLIALTQVSSFNIDLDTQPIKYFNATGVTVPIRFMCAKNAVRGSLVRE